MKKLIIFLGLVLAFLCGNMLFASCSEEDDDEIVTAPVSVEGFLCGKMTTDDHFVLVEDAKTLKQILPDRYTEYLDKVDFSANNILLIADVSNYGVHNIGKNWTKTEGKYKFDIIVHQNELCVIEPWCIAFIVPKTIKKNDVNCEISYVKL